MTIHIRDFNSIERDAKDNGDRRDVNLCENNNAALSLAGDGETAQVLVRTADGWRMIHSFPCENWSDETFWSDIDIDSALCDDDTGLSAYVVTHQG